MLANRYAYIDNEHSSYTNVSMQHKFVQKLKQIKLYNIIKEQYESPSQHITVSAPFG